MIRLHYLHGMGWLVSTRRKPRGYLRFDRRVIRKTTVASHYEAYHTDEWVDRWYAVGLNGVTGNYFENKWDAINDLISNSWFHIGKKKPRFKPYVH